MQPFRPCIIIPTYNNAVTVETVVHQARASGHDVLLVDDGSDATAREVARSIRARGLAHVCLRQHNGGKGAAVKTGLRLAASLGFSHALQVDADGQHALADIPLFFRLAKAHPTALVLGVPLFDASAPIGRRIARRLTIFWVHCETFWAPHEPGGHRIADPMCGFRVYPVAAALACRARGNRMEFDIEVAVRMAWCGTPILNQPTRVRYLERGAGGVSHFRLVEDNLRITWLHTRLVFAALFHFLRTHFGGGDKRRRVRA